MAGFRKAKAEQAAIKMALYGPPGSGKTFTALLVAEGLAALTKKRIAYVDTERGTDFYTKNNPARVQHPAAFDFDAMYTRSITEIVTHIRALNPAEYGVVILDSITHIWEAAIASYAGKETKIGTIPFHAWAKIKKPYKDLLAYLLSSPLHVIICGRQGNEFDTDEESGEMKKIGVKMKAEGETAYEPHILIRMEGRKKQDGTADIVAFAEKDRTSVLTGREIFNPTYKTLIEPIVGLLGGEQAKVESVDEVAAKDAEALSADEAKREQVSADLLKRFKAQLDLATTADEVKAIGKQITPDIKKQMLTADVAALREHYTATEQKVS